MTPASVHGSRARRWSPLLVAVLVAAVSLMGFFEIAEDYRYSAEIETFDSAVSQAVQELRTPAATFFFGASTTVGDTPGTVLVVALAAIVLATRARRRADALFLIGVMSASGLLVAALKGAFGRTRPPVATALVALPGSFSFPSGHSMGSFMLACCAVYLAWRAPGVTRRGTLATALLAGGFALSIGFSRVYLGVHWPSDVIASWLLGGAVFALAAGAYETWRPKLVTTSEPSAA